MPDVGAVQVSATSVAFGVPDTARLVGADGSSASVVALTEAEAVVAVAFSASTWNMYAVTGCRPVTTSLVVVIGVLKLIQVGVLLCSAYCTW